jgi:hypothetical protein
MRIISAINDLRASFITVLRGLDSRRVRPGQYQGAVPIPTPQQGATPPALPPPPLQDRPRHQPQPKRAMSSRARPTFPKAGDVSDDEGHQFKKVNGQLNLIQDSQMIPVATPQSAEEFQALPSGTPFINPADGKLRRKR